MSSAGLRGLGVLSAGGPERWGLGAADKGLRGGGRRAGGGVGGMEG